MNRYIGVMVVLLLAGCEKEASVRGNFVTDISQIKEGSTNKEGVLKAIGSPFLMTKDNRWVYLGRRELRAPFLHPEVESSVDYVIHFNDKDVVTKIEKPNFQRKEVKYDSDNTPVNLTK